MTPQEEAKARRLARKNGNKIVITGIELDARVRASRAYISAHKAQPAPAAIVQRKLPIPMFKIERQVHTQDPETGHNWQEDIFKARRRNATAPLPEFSAMIGSAYHRPVRASCR